MKTKIIKSTKDEQLEAAKGEQQELSRALVRSGKRTQDSMFFIPSNIVKLIKIKHRTTEF
jgi:hypothetical protein